MTAGPGKKDEAGNQYTQKDGSEEMASGQNSE